MLINNKSPPNFQEQENLWCCESVHKKYDIKIT